MPVVFKNPNLPDYFLDFPQVRADTPLAELPSVVQPFESGRVITFSNLRLDIDTAFWASLDTDRHPRLRKLSSRPPEGEETDQALDDRLRQAELPAADKDRLRQEIARVYAQVLPIYERLFAGYAFTRRHAVWRLQTIMNENMHVDTYEGRTADHFARLFINLDDQPRIWKTSWPIADIYARFADRVPPEAAASGDADLFRTQLNRRAFGAGPKEWWDNEPRHVVYFQPGEAWAVDSRQIAHQIFYGRRAVSIDFFVDVKSMRRPARHYLAMAGRLMRRTLVEPGQS